MNIEFRYHPASQKPRQAWILAIFIVLGTAAVFVVINRPLIVFLMAFMLIYNLVPYFFPTDYKLDDEALTMKRLGKEYVYRWDDYRSYTVEANGIVLWTEVSIPSRKDGIRKQMSSINRSVYFPMYPDMIQKSEKLLRQKLVLSNSSIRK